MTGNELAQPAAPVGVFIGRGTRISIPPGGLVIRTDGDGVMRGSATLHLAYDVTPLWLEIALGHMLRAFEAHERVQAAWRVEVDDERLAALESSAESSMQAVVAAATAVDAFYGVTKDSITIDRGLVDKWRRNRTPRPAQVAEVLRVGYVVKKPAVMRDMLQQLYGWRDWAVHPPASLQGAVLHPDIPIQTDWRFVAFRYYNAVACTRIAISIVSGLIAKPRPKWKQLIAYADTSRPRIDPLVERFTQIWDEHRALGLLDP